MHLNEVMLAIPTRGRINYNTAQRLLDLQAKYPEVTYHIEASGISSAQTRHAIIQRFLRTEKQTLLMVDDDVIPPMGVFDLCNSGYDILGGTYLIQMDGVGLPFPGVFLEQDGRYIPMPSIFGKTGRVPCDAVVAGCLAIQRAVLVHDQMQAPFTIPYSPHGLALLSDDLAFCSRARQAGFRIGADFGPAGVYCDHLPDGVSAIRTHQMYLNAWVQAEKVKADEPRVVLA